MAPEGRASRAPVALDWLMLAGVVLLWGSSFAGLRVATETIHPVWIIAGRLAIATLMLAVPALLEIDHELRRPEVRAEAVGWRGVFWLGMVGTVFTALPYVAYATGAQTVPSGVLAICNGAAPIFTAVLASVFSGERLTFARAAGVGMGFVGLVVLVWPTLEGGMTLVSWSLIFAIAAAALYACGNIATRQAPRMSPIASSLVIVATGAVVSIIAAAFLAPWPSAPSAASLLAVIWIGVGPTGLAMIIFVLLIQRTGSMFVAFSTYLIPLWALVLGALFLGERPGVEALAALALILGGVWIGNRR